MKIDQSILNFTPAHDRASCGDDKEVSRRNGISSAYGFGRTGPRCLRCALLDILQYEDGEVPEGFSVEVSLRRYS